MDTFNGTLSRGRHNALETRTGHRYHKVKISIQIRAKEALCEYHDERKQNQKQTFIRARAGAIHSYGDLSDDKIQFANC
jgi:hypothetical protein